LAPRLLVSVRSSDEAASALSGGCDLLDVKEPARGSLGRAEPGAIADIVAVRDRQSPGTPLSVALGELSEWRHGPPADWRPLPLGVQFVKAGLAGMRETPDWPDQWRRLQSLVAAKCSTPAWVLVAYADAEAARAPSWSDVVAVAADLPCCVLLIDTWSKQSARLLDLLNEGELRTCAEACRNHGLLVALAGRLRPADLARAVALAPDIIAVRSAACRDEQRSGPIDPIRVAQLRHRLHSIAPSHDCRAMSR
jgi:uncharacterized protein (UPF0264 family)